MTVCFPVPAGPETTTSCPYSAILSKYLFCALMLVPSPFDMNILSKIVFF